METEDEFVPNSVDEVLADYDEELAAQLLEAGFGLAQLHQYL